MKRITFLLLSIYFILTSNVLSQNTFERCYPNFGSDQTIGLKTIELPNKEFLVLGSSYYYEYINYSNTLQKETIFLSKLDRNGYTIWRKEIETTITKYRKSNQILITNNNEILLAIVQNENSSDALKLIKYDLNGNETNNTTLITDSSIAGCAITKTEDDGYLVSYMQSGSRPSIKIIKTDFQFNILWQKKINSVMPSMIESEIFLKPWGINNYAIGYKNQILKINSQGDSILWTYRRHNFTLELNDGSLLISGTKTLTKLDSSNQVVWIRNFLRDPGPAIQTSDGNYLVCVNSNPDSIVKIDESGNLLWKKPVFGESYSINDNSDNSILISGMLSAAYRIPDPMVYNSYYYEYFKSSWLLKTDSYGNYNTINLITPIGGETIQAFNNFLIGWHSSGVNFVNIKYSTNHGNKWLNITENFDADSGQFLWDVPLLYVDSIIIKLEDANNPNIFNYSEYPVYVSVYQPTDYISTNEIFMWIGNNGMGSHDPRTDGSGFYWPGGDSATIPAIFVDGLVWGGKVNGEIRVNGATYRYGLTPGKIITDGIADDPLATQSKIFKIRKDWQTLPESVLKQRLEYDYNHWPVDAGAPWDDVNEDGVFTKEFDKPKFIGDETLFYVANDLDTTNTRYTYGSDPMGLEFQTTVFGFNREDLKKVVFKKYKVINKSNTNITDMYFTFFADNDMGDASDDFIGCDSSLSLGYTWNSDNDDGYGYGLNPPAIGHMIVQGPKINSTLLDSAFYNFAWIKGFKNLKMTSFGPNFKNSIESHDPPLGVYEGTLEWYNLMQGKKNDGRYWINPYSGITDTFALSGDPVTGTGWYEGLGWPGGSTHGGDRRYSVNTGPFNLTAGDTQEIVIAIPIARGTDNIHSITKLRELVAHVQYFYNTELVDILNTKQTIAPTGYSLSQNYPNPFNPRTIIEYEVPEKSFVTIKIYDILGREVQTLVNNQEQVRYKYKVVFDGSSLASGVYFYRMQAGSYTETKKMVLIK